MKRAKAVEQHMLDDETTDRLLMFLLDVIEDMKNVEEEAHKCLFSRCRGFIRHDKPAGYDSGGRIRMQSALSEMTCGDA